jgi:hypothetical protein
MNSRGRLARRAALAAVSVVIFAVAACSAKPFSGAFLRNAGGGDGSFGAGDTIPANRPFLFAIAPLCTTGGPITVTAVRPIRPTGGLTVVDWGIRHQYPGDPYSGLANPGAEPGRVSQVPGFSSATPVTAKCNDPERVDEFDISVSLPSTRGTMNGVWVYYANGRTLSDVALAVCTTKVCPDLRP